jgi:hypothetical protein
VPKLGRAALLWMIPLNLQLVAWIGLLGFGTFCPDFGDTEDSHISVLTQVFGHTDAMLDLSYTLTIGFAALTVVAYVVLLGALLFGRRDKTPSTGA